MFNKILVIAGPTATGKTDFALRFAKVFDGEIISADSRQVYKGMDIGTGKDIPEGFELRGSDLEFSNEKIGYYTDGNTKIWGYDLVHPNEEFSVAHFQQFAEIVIKDIHSRKKLPIVEGGTGLYIQAIAEGIDTASIPRNKKLRESLVNKSTDQLYRKLLKIDPQKAKKLNNSDKNNPRRLIRAIEIALHSNKDFDQNRRYYDILKIGLILPKERLFDRIEKRVNERIDAGIEEEIKALLDEGIDITAQSMTSIGYRQWIDYLKKNVTKNEAVQEWNKQEKNYAKRQMSWFKRDREIKWIDVTEKDFLKTVEKLVKEWYKGE